MKGRRCFGRRLLPAAAAPSWSTGFGEVRTFRIHYDEGLQYDHEPVAVRRP